MELQKFKELAQKMTYKGMPCMSISDRDWRNGFSLVPNGYIYVAFWINTIDVNDGTPAKIEDGGLWAIKDIEETSEWSHITNAKNRIVGLETHEVEECFAIDNVRIFNPHEKVKSEILVEQKEAA